MENEKFLSLETAIMSELGKDIRLKNGQYAVDEEGNVLKGPQAIAMSIVRNAMSGDIQAATFLRNTIRTNNSRLDEERRNKLQEKIENHFNTIKDELSAEGLYVGQDVELSLLARNLAIIEELDSQMALPDYEDVYSEYRKDGGISIKVNPIHELRDKYQKDFFLRLEKVKIDSVRSRQNIIKNRKK